MATRVCLERYLQEWPFIIPAVFSQQSSQDKSLSLSDIKSGTLTNICVRPTKLRGLNVVCKWRCTEIFEHSSTSKQSANSEFPSFGAVKAQSSLHVLMKYVIPRRTMRGIIKYFSASQRIFNLCPKLINLQRYFVKSFTRPRLLWFVCSQPCVFFISIFIFVFVQPYVPETCPMLHQMRKHLHFFCSRDNKVAGTKPAS